jgi:selenide,water dikinase
VLRHVDVENTDPAVLVGLASPDDAGVYLVTPDLAIVQTVDFFTPIVDDPFDWGRIAAVNALSDIYAMGARPLTALNLVAWPRTLDFELLGRVLDGAGDACMEAGVAVIGGHSVDDPEPKFGLAVTGSVHPDAIVTTSGARPGADLVLTKPLGMGVISTAIKEGRADDSVVRQAVAIMGTLNRAASEVMIEVGVQAATDVTGFGLLGHLREMLGPALDARVGFRAVPIVEGATALAAEGLLPGGSRRNIDSLREHVELDGLDFSSAAVLFDAQTSGGLLMAVDTDKTHALVAALQQRGVDGAAVIGSLKEGSGRIRIEA